MSSFLLAEVSPTMRHSPTYRKIGLALFACLQNTIGGGLVFGWASISGSMLAAPLESGGANLTSLETTHLFSKASAVAMMASLFLGPVLDTFGPRTCLSVSHLLVAAGCGCFALSSKYWQFAASVVMIAFGGPGIGLGIIHNANLFPKRQFLAVSILAGSITLSFSMLAVLEAIQETYHVSFRALFGSYGGIVALSMIATLLISPDDPYEMVTYDNEEDDDSINEESSLHSSKMAHPSLEQQYVEATIQTYSHHHKHHLLMTDSSLQSTLRRPRDPEEDTGNEVLAVHPGLEHPYHQPVYHRTLSFYQSKEAAETGNEVVVKLMSLKDQCFRVQVRSSTYSRAVLIFIVTSFFANFTIASLNTELEDLESFSQSQQHNLSQQFTWSLSLGMPYAVFVGLLMDHVGLEVCTLVTLLLGQLSTLLMMLASLDFMSELNVYRVMLFGFALYSLFRQFLYPVFLAYITSRLGYKYFGILSGLGFFLSGMVQWFMADLVALVHRGCSGSGSQWIPFHIFQIALLGILMVIPIADHREIQQREAQMQAALESLSTETKDKRLSSNASTPVTTSASSFASARKEQDPLKGNAAENRSGVDYRLH